jgi:hypothetical protein
MVQITVAKGKATFLFEQRLFLDCYLSDFYIFLLGLCPASPFGFACFGSFIAKMGNIAAGHRFVLLAKSLLNKVNARETTGEMLSVLGICRTSSGSQ